jgi:DNA-binding NarL/FixJ family response regulator
MKVIVAEDSGFFRDALVTSLQSSGIDVVGSTADARDVAALVTESDPDVAVLDICLPPTKTDEGLTLAEHLAGIAPRTGVLLLSAYLSTPHVTRVLNGSRRNIGCLSKDQLHDADVLLRAVEAVGRGETFIDPEFVEQRLHSDFISSMLTEREMELLRSVAEGHSNQAIACRHHINVKTVERTLTSVFRKLHIDSAEGNARVRAALLFLSRPQSFIKQQGVIA